MPAMTPRSPEDVEVFLATKPDRPFVEVGALEARRKSIYSADDMPELIDAMRVEAARRGCDGVIIVGKDDEVFGMLTQVAGYGSGVVGTLKGFEGSCIVFAPTR
jgi:hypothetical protein